MEDNSSRHPVHPDVISLLTSVIFSKSEKLCLHLLAAFVLLFSMESMAGLQDLVISEIHYHPVTAEELEFVEIWNSGSESVSLQGVQLADAIEYTFPAMTLSAGARTVVCSDRTQFLNFYTPRFPNVSQVLAPGTFLNRLNNAEETLQLLTSNGTVLQTVFYQDLPPWPNRADGAGSSLEWVHSGPKLTDSSTHWRPSFLVHGSPGESGTERLIPVALNELLIHTDLPLEDAIEVINLSSEPIPMDGWFLTDSVSELNRYLIPAGTTLEPNGFHVFYEQAFNFTNPGIPFALSSAFGDRVLLVATDAAGEPFQFVDDVEFGATQNGISYGRFPDGTGVWTRLKDLSFGTDVRAGDDPANLSVFRTGTGAPNATPLVGPVYVKEIHYHPVDSGVEYVTIFNEADFPVALYDAGARTNTWSLKSAVEFSFPEEVVIQSRESIVVAGEDPLAFRNRFGLSESVRVFGPFTGALNNAGELLQLVKPDPPQTTGDQIGFVPQIVVENIEYQPFNPWPVKADGLGGSLHRIHITGAPGDPDQWAAGFPTFDTDTDLDGTPDSWEIWYGLNPASSLDATLDLDQDGASALSEYHAGSDPTDSSSVLKFNATLNLSGDLLTVEFFRRPDRSYVVESLNSFSAGNSWTAAEDFPAIEAGFHGPVDWIRSTIEIPISISDTPTFLRIRESANGI